MIRLMAWNVGGARTKVAPLGEQIQSLMQFYQIDVIGLCETRGMSVQLAESAHLHLVYASDEGSHGGVAFLSRHHTRNFKIVNNYHCPNRLIQIEWTTNEFGTINLIMVYGSSTPKHNIPLESILSHSRSGPTICMGDWNNVNTKNCLHHMVDPFHLQSNINDIATHTRGNRLDRYYMYDLNNCEVELLHIPYVRTKEEPHVSALSDHKPILLTCTRNGHQTRWKYPSWALDVPEIDLQMQAFLHKHAHLPWSKYVHKIRTTLAFIIQDIHSDPYVQDEINRKRQTLIEENKEFNINPNRFQTRKVKKAQQTSGSTSISHVLDFYRNLYRGEPFTHQHHAPAEISDLLHSIITIDKIASAINESEKDSSPGPNGITYEFLKKYSRIICNSLYQDYITFHHHVDNVWKQGYISPLPKKGDLSNLENWRPISLLNTEWKIFTSLVNQSLQSLSKDMIEEEQIGFKKGKWIHEHHLTLQAAIKKNHGGAILFIDFKKAYDSVYHSHIFNTIHSLHGPSWAKLIMNIVCGGSSKVYFRQKLSSPFPIRRGVRQGDVISPLLFNLCINQLIIMIKNTIPGCDVYGAMIQILAYADDIAIVLKSEEDLIKVQNLLDQFKSISGLEINVSKTQIMYSPTATWRSNTFEEVKQYKYLGLFIDQFGNFLIEEIIKKTNDRLNILSNCFGFNNTLHKVRAINCYALSVLNYSMKVIYFDESCIDQINDKIKECLGSKGKRITLSRLTATNGGYKLIHLKNHNLKMLLSWLFYLKNDETKSKFHHIIENWSKDIDEVHGLQSRLISKDAFVPLPKVAPTGHRKKPPKSQLPSRTLCTWRSTTSKKTSKKRLLKKMQKETEKHLYKDNALPHLAVAFTKKQITPNSTSTENSNYISQLQKSQEMHFFNPSTKNWESTEFNWSRRKRILNCSLYKTKAQERWERERDLDLEECISNLKKTQLPEYIKATVLDAWHINLSICYKQDKCGYCNKRVGSFHYLGDCEGYNYIKSRIKNFINGKNLILKDNAISVLTTYLLWRYHCCKTHGEAFKMNGVINSTYFQIQLYQQQKKRLHQIRLTQSRSH